MSLTAHPGPKRPRLPTRHNKSMLKWAAEEQTNTVSSCPPWQRWKKKGFVWLGVSAEAGRTLIHTAYWF